MVWGDVVPKNNWGWNVCNNREALLAKGTNERSVTAADIWYNAVGRQ